MACASSYVGIVFFVELFCGDDENPLRNEGEDIELVTWISKYILVFVFAISQLNSTCLYLVLLLLLNSYMLDIMTIVWSKKAIEAPQLFKREILRRISRALHRKFSFTFWNLYLC